MVSLSSSSMLLAVVLAALLSNVVHAVEFFAPDWVIPLQIGTPYPGMTANAGDSLTFAWSQGTHDVWIYPSGSCDPTGGIQIGTITDNPTTYTFTDADAGQTLTFVCDIGAHCQAGMIMDVTVLGTASDGGAEEEATLEEVTNEEEQAVAEVEAAEEPAEETAEEPAEETAEETAEESAAAEEEQSTGEFGACYVCGSQNDSITNGDAIITLPNPGNPPFSVSCSQLEQDGLNGLIPQESCPFISQQAVEPCGCTLNDFTCSVCGDEYKVRLPEAEIFLPSDPATARSCGELEQAGLSGDLSPADCNNIQNFQFMACQCSPTDFSCSICGEGFEAGNSDALIEIPEWGVSTTCGELESSGLAGSLPPAQCIAAEALNRVTNVCGCIPQDGGFPVCPICEQNNTLPLTPDVNITLTPFETYTCGELVQAGAAGELSPAACVNAQNQAFFGCNCGQTDYTCNVCGGDGISNQMLNPENNFTIPELGVLANCGEVDAAGLDGFIVPNDCDVVSPLVQESCGCAPTDFTCNLCGEDSDLVVTEEDVAFVPGDDITCGEAFEAGLAGEIDPQRCEALTALAQFSCGCAADINTEAPEESAAVAATDAPTNATATVTDTVAQDTEPEPATETAGDATETTPEVGEPAAETAPETTAETPAAETPATNETPATPDAAPAAEESAVTEEAGDATTDVPDLTTDNGAVTSSIEGSGNKSKSDSTAISSGAVMALSCLMGIAVALFI